MTDEEKKQFDELHRETEAYKNLIRQMKETSGNINVTLNYQLIILKQRVVELESKVSELDKVLRKIRNISFGTEEFEQTESETRAIKEKINKIRRTLINNGYER